MLAPGRCSWSIPPATPSFMRTSPLSYLGRAGLSCFVWRLLAHLLYKHEILSTHVVHSARGKCSIRSQLYLAGRALN